MRDKKQLSWDDSSNGYPLSTLRLNGLTIKVEHGHYDQPDPKGEVSVSHPMEWPLVRVGSCSDLERFTQKNKNIALQKTRDYLSGLITDIDFLLREEDEPVSPEMVLQAFAQTIQEEPHLRLGQLIVGTMCQNQEDPVSIVGNLFRITNEDLFKKILERSQNQRIVKGDLSQEEKITRPDQVENPRMKIFLHLGGTLYNDKGMYTNHKYMAWMSNRWQEWREHHNKNLPHALHVKQHGQSQYSKQFDAWLVETYGQGLDL